MVAEVRCLLLHVLEAVEDQSQILDQSKSSDIEKGGHRMPLALSSVAGRIIKSMAMCRHHAALSYTCYHIKAVVLISKTIC